ncbi:MAG TPA: NAD(P)/FAD-dependent oxidoreductase [Candidatus Binatia bacterium]|nr:NAD(P)/FAD-dependent oxidoreductase [Candidatus Binatia bacterium]
MEQPWDIAVIGAGAAGLAAGIFAAESARARGQAARIVLLDSAQKIGAKILVSGGGRCNVTHEKIRPEDFNGSKNIVRNVLAAFDEQATVRWFDSLGVPLKREATGKLFPVSDSARTVLDALLRRCGELAVSVLTGHRVYEVIPREPLTPGQETAFTVRHAQGALCARRVVMATGGRSLPRTGSDGSGWAIARRLGHTVTETCPALVPLVLREGAFHAELSGLSLPVELSLAADGKLIDRRTGSLLWTHFGVSGPVVMDASRHWVIARAGGRTVEARCNFLPGQNFEQVESWLVDGARSRPRTSVGGILARQLPERLAGALVRAAGIDPGATLSQLARVPRRALVHALTAFVLPVERERGWNFAEVTAGGVPLSEIDYRTMASRKVPGLYLVGEVLDCDGRIGGFNFQWAWATGYLAGRACARREIPSQEG